MVTRQGRPPQDNSYETTEIKLAAVILSTIPDSTFEVYSQDNSTKKVVRVIYSSNYEQEVNKLMREFIERQARVDVYKYNMALNMLRDRIKRE